MIGLRPVVFSLGRETYFTNIAQGVLLSGGTCGGASSSPFSAAPRRMAARGACSADCDAGDRISWRASPDAFASRLRAFRQGLKTGYAEGQNVAIEFRWAEGQHDRLPALAADLVHRRVAVIVAPGGTPAALAAKSATATIPIVFEIAVDPVAIGFVGSLNRPGGNLTGVTNLNVEVTPKRLEFLRELLPAATMFAVLINPTSPSC